MDYSKIHTFRNKKIVDTGKGFKHRGYYPTGSDPATVDSSSFTDGRPVGRTHYFATASDGTILYPSNHYPKAKTSKESLVKLTYGGIKALNKYIGVKTEYYDPLGLDTSPTQAVTTISVEGSNTSTGIVAVDRGGVKNNNESGSIGGK